MAMTQKEENIVNIAMMAASLLKEGKIQHDEIAGHIGITQNIISLAEKFEKANAGVNFDAEGRDYWIEIDEFAEAELKQLYGKEMEAGKAPAKVHCLCEEYEDNDGIRQFTILAVSEDEKKLQELMEARIKGDPYGIIAKNGVDDHWDNHFSTNFDNGFVEYYIVEEPVRSREELLEMIKHENAPEEEQALPEGPVKVYAVSPGGVKRELFSGNWDECNAFCEQLGYTYIDENKFEWELEVEDSRNMPKGYHKALFHYGDDIENEFVRQHAQELVFCYENGKQIQEFDEWTHFEDILSESITYDEYTGLNGMYGEDLMEIQKKDTAIISQMTEVLEDIRWEAEAMKHRWFLEVVQDHNGTYYANMVMGGKRVEGLPEYVSYNALREAIRTKTGVEILKKKDMKFQGMGRKNYAYLDVTQPGPDGGDCRVTLADIKAGWRPNFGPKAPETQLDSCRQDAGKTTKRSLDEQIGSAASRAASPSPALQPKENELPGRKDNDR